MDETRADRAAARRAWSLALIALAMDFAVPLLPVYGAGHTRFAGLPPRIVIIVALSEWGSVLVVGFGIWLLRRVRGAIAAGMFLAVAILTSIRVASEVITTTDVLTRWESLLVLGIWAAEAVLLFLATASALGGSRPSRLDQRDVPPALS
ncbi:MAG: hypothetical protein A2Z48_12700 [Actinobacteria bacterium RBG_19FT_COMBO_70_19]|nr:MAG: hypothetical protein A2Z48_12700 [Actinobacteria bacterium RBG_19FT_COMBO_70_19]